ncbi:MAG: type IX secretion system membrane protein PorP/SprF, partial [Gelidibacter sp.]
MKQSFRNINPLNQILSGMSHISSGKNMGYGQIKTLVLTLVCFCSVQLFYSQEDDGVVSLALPIRNSLTFNRYVINPTFSFVREQNKYISVYNKREWVQFEDAPQTYLLGYSGRFADNIGAGLGLFQQDYGV